MTKKKILVAQDRKSTFDLLKMMAEYVNFPFTFDWVVHGEHAVNKIKEGEEYDGILMNLEMPVMDGITATKEIRKLGYTKPIIAWSGHFRSWKWAECKEAGMDEYVEIGPYDMIESITVAFYMCGLIKM